MDPRLFVPLLLSLLVHGLAQESAPLAGPSRGETPFTLLSPKSTGIEFQSPLLEDHPLNYLYHSGFACGAVAIGDVDGDGRPDLFFTNGPGKNALYLQRGPLQFEEAPAALGLSGGNRWGTGCAMVDIDNDGDLDLYVCNYRGRHELYVNQLVPTGKLAFEDRAPAMGLDLVNASMTPAFADMDLDGDLDLFMLNNRLERPEGRPAKPPYKVVQGKPQVLPEFAPFYRLRQNGPKSFEMDAYGQPDRLYRNDKGVFVDVTVQAGISGEGHGLSATWWDYNEDGYPDVYVGNDFTDPDRLYRNNKDGTFTDVLGETMPYCSWSSMGSASADLNNDGLVDLFSADMAATSHFKQKINMGDMSKHRWLMETGWPRQIMRNMLYINTGIHRFKETAFMSGVAQSDWTWAVKLADFDSDGWTDVYLSNGMARNFSNADIPMGAGALVGRTEFEVYRDTPPMREKNLAFRNRGGLKFDDVSESWNLDALGMSYGAAQGDLDGDGDVDLVVMNLGESPSVYRNDIGTGHRLTIALEGSASNRAGWGSTVRVEAGGVVQTRYLHPITGFQGCDLAELNFGLGERSVSDVVTVKWPSGRQTRLTNLAAGRRYVLREKDAGGEVEAAPTKTPSLFVERARELGLTYRHLERPYDDYAKQPLLPGKLSQLGPGMAWGDMDADGDDDLFVGGAAGRPGALFRQDEGRFVQVSGPWGNDRESEDMGMVWLDADRDGDLDLFVASGGVEHMIGSPALRDRLYLNLGQGRFVRAGEEVLPQAFYSSGVVTAADYDRDGDVDLFVGSRSIPGDYPLGPASRLLRNESQPGRPKFADVSKSFSGLADVGMVTGAVWTDVNGDAWPDLALVSEWDSLRLFVSRGGRLELEPAAVERAGLLGWWNGLASGDLDGDGDVDFVATNVGLNTKYGRPSVKKPSLLYYGDMDSSGVRQLVEAKSGEEGLLPIRGRSCSSRAMPFIAKKFESYRSFAQASLEAIYTRHSLAEAERFEGSEFQTGIFRNVSQGGVVRFEFEPLPFAAQATPGYGVSILDGNGDGNVDLAIVGNLYTREPETGLWRGAMGLLLAGDGRGGFDEVPYAQSGFVVPGDGKSLTRSDINGDGVPDLVAGQNNDQLMAFVSEGAADGYVSLRLRGKPGNPSALGARAVLHLNDGTTRMASVDGGSGYLSQSSAELFFGIGAGKPKEVVVTWPDGSTSRHEVTTSRLKLTQP